MARVDELLKTTERPIHFGLVEIARALRRYMAGDWIAAYNHAVTATDILAKVTGHHWEKAGVSTLTLWSLYYLGDINQMNAVGRTQYRDALERDDLFAASGSLMCLNNIIYLNAGGPDQARSALEQVMRRWSTRGYHLQHFWHFLAQMHIDLYCDEGERAYERLQSELGALRSSLLLHIPSIRNETFSLSARSALAMARRGKGDTGRWLTQAGHDLKKLCRGHVRWTKSIGKAISAEIELIKGEEGNAVSLLTECIDDFDSQLMRSYAAAARLKLAAIVGGDEGLRLRGKADAYFGEHHIASPEAFAKMLIT